MSTSHRTRASLEVVQQAQDALLLALPELRAPAVPDVFCILWGDKRRVTGLDVNLGAGAMVGGVTSHLSLNPSSQGGACCSNASTSPQHGSCAKLLDLAFEVLSEKGQLTFLSRPHLYLLIA